MNEITIKIIFGICVSDHFIMRVLLKRKDRLQMVLYTLTNPISIFRILLVNLRVKLFTWTYGQVGVCHVEKNWN